MERATGGQELAPATSGQDAFPTWPTFAEPVPPRLLLPVHAFEYRIQYVPVLLQRPERMMLANIARSAVVEALNHEPLCELADLSLWVNPAEDVQPDPGVGEASYFSVIFDNPVFGFRLAVGPTTLMVRKERGALENLVRSIPLFVLILDSLFPHVGATAVDRPSLSDVLGPHIHRINFQFQMKLTLGRRLSDETADATNYELLRKLARLEIANESAQEAPFAALQPDAVLRGDVTFGFVKKIASRPRQLWITLNAPWNITRKDVELVFDYRLGESDAPMAVGDLLDLQTPVVDYYRDLLIRRFIADLFHDINVSGRV